jgi:acyl carrier protein
MSLTINNVEGELFKFIKDHLNPVDENFTFHSNLFEDGYIDSVRLEKLFSYVEDTFNLVFEEDHFFDERISSIAGIAEIIRENMASG